MSYFRHNIKYQNSINSIYIYIYIYMYVVCRDEFAGCLPPQSNATAWLSCFEEIQQENLI
jgi:hypothetical protein